MQVNNPKNNTSNLIKQSEFAKKKAIRRLIGSVFMLLTALIILLNVTTKVKPIPVTPKAIEISSNASVPVKASAPTRQIAATSSSPVAASAPIAAVAPATNASQPQDQGFKVGVLSQNTDQNQTQQPAETVTASPLIIAMNIGKKPSPADILNGNTNSTAKTIYYVQIAASQNKSGLQNLQATLTEKNIKTFIQTGKNNFFRLRSGPFASKDEANSNLAQIKTSLK